MGITPMSDSNDTRKPALSWSDKIRIARAQARELRQKEMEEALERGDTEEYDRLVAAENERVNGRRNAKLEAAKQKRDAKALAPKAGGVVWANNETAKDWRAGKRSGRRRNNAGWALTPGAMVRLVNDARVYTEGSWVMEKKIPKGTLGILIDAPPSDLHGHVAVMFGADIFKIECKKIRMVHDDE